MKKSEAEKRIGKLKKTINHYRYLYHVLDREEISSEALDSLKKELFDLEQLYPDLITPDSPTQRIGGKPLKKFKKFRHPERMTSFNDAFSREDMEDWLKRNLNLLKGFHDIEFYCEPKLDGLAIELIYEDGFFKIGATRGDGIVGEDVTQNLKTIEAIPLKIDWHGSMVVRGEAIISKKEFERINNQREKDKLPLYANPRNLAAGSIRQLDSNVAKERHLSVDIYDVVSDFGQKTHKEEHELLEKLGFKTNNKYNKVCKNLNEVFAYQKWLEKTRQRLPYQIDGVVVTINNNQIFKELGIVGKAPRGAIALKFPQVQATTKVLEVEFQTGRTGVITPVAILKPVSIGGVTISRATLHNEQEIKRLGLKIGDTVIVGRAGDVIPEISSALKELRDGTEREIVIPKKCPSCGFPLKRGNILWFCPNKDCYDRKLRSIVHFISKGAFDIVGMGPSIAKQLLEKKLISDPADIFSLKKGDLLELDGFEEKSSENLLKAISEKKNISLSRFIYAIGIANIGQETANLLSDHFRSIENLKKAKIEDLENILDIGPIMASSIHEWFESKSNILLLEKLNACGISIHLDKKEGAFMGKKFVLTGSLKMPRDQVKDIIRSLGGKVSSSLSQNIDFLVAGEKPGSKYGKAKEMGIKIIFEKEFYELIKTS